MTGMINARNAALAFAAAFIGAGLLGFVPNPLVAPDGVFAVNAMHNLVHIVTGAAFLAGAIVFQKAQLTLRIVGLLYIVVTVLGFLTTGDKLLWLIHINEADRWLHAGLALVIVAAGFGIRDTAAVENASAAS